jgi:beta-phosphoglucomutase-like phosphatase (HAD superfamily)
MPPVRDIRALIFDFDGTLADTMPLHWRAWQTVLERHGLQLTEERFYSLGGVPARDILRQLGREQGITLDPHEAAREKVATYVPLIPEIRPIAPVLDIARRHRGRWPLAIATGGTRWVIEKALRHLALETWFDMLVTSEDVRRQKPAPDIYLEAARRLGVPPEHCRAYEDTDLGLEAIRAAGMEAVDVRELLRAPA